MLPYSNLRLILITFRDRIVHNLIRMTNDDFYKKRSYEKSLAFTEIHDKRFDAQRRMWWIISEPENNYCLNIL